MASIGETTSQLDQLAMVIFSPGMFIRPQMFIIIKIYHYYNYYNYYYPYYCVEVTQYQRFIPL